MHRVLIVDDEEMYRFYLGQFLEREKFEVRSASSGQEAIEVGRRFVPDVLIADWKLENNYNGFQVSEALSNLNPRLATIIITGFPSPELHRMAAERVMRVFQKPFEPEDLVSAVRELLCRK